jgi:hypothetical protein
VDHTAVGDDRDSFDDRANARRLSFSWALRAQPRKTSFSSGRTLLSTCVVPVGRQKRTTEDGHGLCGCRSRLWASRGDGLRTRMKLRRHHEDDEPKRGTMSNAGGDD